MRYSKVLKLGAVGLALLLIPRRSSRQSERGIPSQPSPTEQPNQQVGKDATDNGSTDNATIDNNTIGKATDK